MKKLHLNWTGRFCGPATKSIKSAVVLLGTSSTLVTQAVGSRAPELPDVCDRIAAPEANKVAFHVFAVGVQIYRWSGTNWAFVAPQATLYADANHRAQVGTHFGTPT